VHQRLHVFFQTQPQINNKLPLCITPKETTPDIQHSKTKSERLTRNSETAITLVGFFKVDYCIRFLYDAPHPMKNAVFWSRWHVFAKWSWNGAEPLSEEDCAFERRYRVLNAPEESLAPCHSIYAEPDWDAERVGGIEKGRQQIVVALDVG
jgi:hypothetical protein